MEGAGYLPDPLQLRSPHPLPTTPFNYHQRGFGDETKCIARFAVWRSEMIYQPTIFVKGYLDVRVWSSLILVYGVTTRWLLFAHPQSICTRSLDQIVVWGGDEASPGLRNLVLGLKFHANWSQEWNINLNCMTDNQSTCRDTACICKK